jgi:hypothetical protein
MLMLMGAAPGAQRRRADNGSEGLPVATNIIRQNPDAYYGKLVTVSAGVDEILSKTAFVIDQRKAVGAGEVKAIGMPILVIAPYLASPPDQKNYLLVRGQVVKFDAMSILGAIARLDPDYTIDFAAEIEAKYQGQPVLVATSVINAAFAELARKPLPPPGPEEVSLSAAMKTIGPAFAALRTAVQESKTDAVVQNVATLKPAFNRTESAWDNLGQSAPAEWAREAQAHSASIEGAAAAGNWDAVKTSAFALNQLCQNCHGIYRERQEDGTFRIKPGLF